MTLLGDCTLELCLSISLLLQWIKSTSSVAMYLYFGYKMPLGKYMKFILTNSISHMHETYIYEEIKKKKTTSIHLWNVSCTKNKLKQV